MLVDPARLLDDCERAWREAGEPAGGGGPESVVRRTTLVMEALMAYALLADRAGLPRDAVFARWPACTIHAVTLGEQRESLSLGQLLSEARARVVEARPDLDRPRADPNAPATESC